MAQLLRMVTLPLGYHHEYEPEGGPTQGEIPLSLPYWHLISLRSSIRGDYSSSIREARWAQC